MKSLAKFSKSTLCEKKISIENISGFLLQQFRNKIAAGAQISLRHDTFQTRSIIFCLYTVSGQYNLNVLFSN